MSTTGPRVFVSYRHTPEDKAWKERVVTHLRALSRAGLLDVWDDTRIPAGADWHPEIARALEACDVALLLVSADWLDSDFVLDEEVPRLLERRAAAGVRVIPVLVRPCPWQPIDWLARMQPWPRTAEPLSSLPPNDAEQSLADLASDVLSVPRGAGAAWPSAGQVDITRLPQTGGEFLGRGAELAWLDAAWAEAGRTHVAVLVAAGGVGKTTLVKRWLDRVKADAWRGARRVFGWSFYSQGTGDDRQASDDAFLSAALGWFGVAHPASLPAADKGRLLAEALRRERVLLVLDGVEPLQHPPGPLGGRLRAPGLEALLVHLAGAGAPGLVVVTTREALADLREHERGDEHAAGGVVARDLGNLDEADGARLLHRLGVRRAGAAPVGDGDDELRAASREARGHALALSLLGRYLAQAHAGDVRRRDQVRFSEADARVRGGHAFKILSAYERWLESGGESGRRALAVVRLLGLFDRPADVGCLAALRQGPPIAGLTERLFDRHGWRAWFRKPLPLDEPQWRLALSRLAECGLVLHRESDSAPLDAHPLVREHFARRLREEGPEAWRAGHRRLYEHLKASVPHRPEGLSGLQPLYQAVAHGCHAGLHQQACAEVYDDRILRGTGAGGFYSTKKLGAFGADLGAVACFFEEPWSRLAAGLAEADQAWLLNEAAFSLRALGRLTEALEPMRAGLALRIRQQVWTSAARIAGNLSELELTLGDVAAAVRDAEQSVAHADRGGDAFLRMVMRTTLADALHHAGRRGEAEEHFREAEALQAERQPQYPWLYSLRGFCYCDLLLAEAERAAAARPPLSPGRGGQGSPAAHPVPLPAAPRRTEQGPDKRGEGSAGQRAGNGDPLDDVARRAAKMFDWRVPNDPLLDIALDHLTLARVALYRAVLEPARAVDALATARQHAADAVDGLRAAGRYDYLPRGLLTRAWLRAVDGDDDGARADLDEARRIAERGSMRLHLADAHLHRARLFRDRPALKEARRLIDATGYHRRDAELHDAEAAAAAWPDTPDSR